MAKRHEQAIHVAVVEHLRLRAAPGTLFIHVPNAPRSARAGAQLKRMGMRAGAPDLLLWRNGESFALELKTEKGRISTAQSQFLTEFHEAGGISWVAYGLDQALCALKAWGLIE